MFILCLDFLCSITFLFFLPPFSEDHTVCKPHESLGFRDRSYGSVAIHPASGAVGAGKLGCEEVMPLVLGELLLKSHFHMANHCIVAVAK